MNKIRLCRAALFAALSATLVAGTLASTAAGAAQTLGLREAIDLARERDPWLTGSEQRQRALAARAVAASSLPDPTVSMGAANLPVDSFDVHQEPMTQFKVGVTQMFPRGESRELARERLQQQAHGEVFAREERREQTALAVAGLWLDAYRATESMRLIEADRGLFEYLVEVARAGYSSAVGGARQQDVIRAQLELTRLDDRVATLRQQRDTALAALVEYLGGALGNSAGTVAVDVGGEPQLALRARRLQGAGPVDRDWLQPVLLAHPVVRGLESSIATREVDRDLARQQYRPQWGINAGYGYRDSDPAGVDRSDFFSVGVTFDLPLFTGARQDRELEAASAAAEASRTDKALALRRLLAGFERELARLRQLEARKSLYQGRLLSQMHDQSEIALAAYTSDDGDFAEVVRARIDELNAQVEALGIEVERLRAIAGLNYFLAGLNHVSPDSTEAPAP